MVVGTIALVVLAGAASYFTTQLTQAKTIFDTKEELRSEITNVASVAAADVSKDRERISALEEAVSTIKTTNADTANLVRSENEKTRASVDELRGIMYTKVIPFIKDPN
jgi:hypothetical protein